MALIICPECGKEISEFATSCPHCGCPAAFFNKKSVYIQGVNIGDKINFGNYQRFDEKQVGLEWTVLDVVNKALLFNDYCIAWKPFFDKGIKPENMANAWRDSSIRKYLNTEFYDTCFSADEKRLIMNISNSNKENPYWMNAQFKSSRKPAGDGDETDDKVFLLSLEDVLAYGLDGDTGDVKKYSDYDEQLMREVGDDFNKYCLHGDYSWFLRTPGYEYYSDDECRLMQIACYKSSLDVVDSNGRIIEHYPGKMSTQGSAGVSKNGIRPALWVCVK